MSDYHFGMDYDMWLYPPVDWAAPDYDYELPEPIEAANIEGNLLVNAEDAIEQVRRLQAENAKLMKLVRDMHAVISDRNSWWDFMRKDTRRFADRMCELGVEVDV